jgi:hypothetical protein
MGLPRINLDQFVQTVERRLHGRDLRLGAGDQPLTVDYRVTVDGRDLMSGYRPDLSTGCPQFLLVHNKVVSPGVQLLLGTLFKRVPIHAGGIPYLIGFV